MSEATDSELASDERQPRGPRWKVGAVVLAFGVLIAGLGVVLKVALDAKSASSELRSDLAVTRRELAQQNDDIIGLRLAVSDVDAIRLSISDLSSAMDDMDDTSFAADEALAEVEFLRDCLNRYMDVIADWSSNVNSYYEYRRC